MAVIKKHRRLFWVGEILCQNIERKDLDMGQAVDLFGWELPVCWEIGLQVLGLFIKREDGLVVLTLFPHCDAVGELFSLLSGIEVEFEGPAHGLPGCFILCGPLEEIEEDIIVSGLRMAEEMVTVAAVKGGERLIKKEGPGEKADGKGEALLEAAAVRVELHQLFDALELL